MSTATDSLTIQFLEWLSASPRTYNEVMDVWRTSCPRLSTWEDALHDGLIQIETGGTHVSLTPHGSQILERSKHPA